MHFMFFFLGMASVAEQNCNCDMLYRPYLAVDSPFIHLCRITVQHSNSDGSVYTSVKSPIPRSEPRHIFLTDLVDVAAKWFQSKFGSDVVVHLATMMARTHAVTGPANHGTFVPTLPPSALMVSSFVFVRFVFIR